MKQILAFDSMYIVNPIGRVYVNCVNRIVNNRNFTGVKGIADKNFG